MSDWGHCEVANDVSIENWSLRTNFNRIVFPTIVGLGVLLNIFQIFLHCRQHLIRRHHISIYLTALACFTCLHFVFYYFVPLLIAIGPTDDVPCRFSSYLAAGCWCSMRLILTVLPFDRITQTYLDRRRPTSSSSFLTKFCSPFGARVTTVAIAIISMAPYNLKFPAMHFYKRGYCCRVYSMTDLPKIISHDVITLLFSNSTAACRRPLAVLPVLC